MLYVHVYNIVLLLPKGKSREIIMNIKNKKNKKNAHAWRKWPMFPQFQQFPRLGPPGCPRRWSPAVNYLSHVCRKPINQACSQMSLDNSCSAITLPCTSLTMRIVGVRRTARVNDSSSRADLHASRKLVGLLCSRRTRRSSSVIASMNCSFACVSCMAVGASPSAKRASLSMSSAISTNGSPRWRRRLRNFTRFSSFCMAVPMTCHILLRFKSYSNGVKSHYVVVLFACTR